MADSGPKYEQIAYDIPDRRDASEILDQLAEREDRCMQTLKVLIVEDHIPSLELMTEVFTSLKAEVCPISDSEKAVAMVNQEKFDGIFLDLEMPKLNGF